MEVFMKFLTKLTFLLCCVSQALFSAPLNDLQMQKLVQAVGKKNQAFGKKNNEEKLTPADLKEYVNARFEYRQNYWKNQYRTLFKGRDKQDVLNEQDVNYRIKNIPYYICFNEFCRSNKSDEISLPLINCFFITESSDNSKKNVNGFYTKDKIHIKNNLSNDLFFHVVEHELTHHEQFYSRLSKMAYKFTLEKTKQKDEKISEQETKEQKTELVDKYFPKKPDPADESEADYYGVHFNPNPEDYEKFLYRRLNFDQNVEVIKEGYLSPHEQLSILYKLNPKIEQNRIFKIKHLKHFSFFKSLFKHVFTGLAGWGFFSCMNKIPSLEKYSASMRNLFFGCTAFSFIRSMNRIAGINVNSFVKVPQKSNLKLIKHLYTVDNKTK